MSQGARTTAVNEALMTLGGNLGSGRKVCWISGSGWKVASSECCGGGAEGGMEISNRCACRGSCTNEPIISDTLRLPYIFKPQIITFIGLLGAFEGLLLWYWLALRLGQVLAYGAALGAVTVLAGNRALNSLAKWRVESTQK